MEFNTIAISDGETMAPKHARFAGKP